MPYRGGDIRSSRPLQYQRRASIDTRLLIGIAIIAAVALWAAWRLAQLPPGVLWWWFR
jgi:hypothetical protein